VVSELAWHNLFIRHLLRRPSARELDTFAPEFTIINCPASRPIPNGTAAAATR
jgi:phosphoenolpyruvate carboxykinase (ATP)